MLTGFAAICASGVVIFRFLAALCRDLKRRGRPPLLSLRGAQVALIAVLVVISGAALSMLASGILGFDGFGFGDALARSVRLYDFYRQAASTLNPGASCPNAGAPLCVLIVFSQSALNVGLCAALMLSVAAAAISYRWPIFGDAWHDPDNLRRQRSWLIALFVLGSALLVFGTSTIRAAEDWALGVYGSARSDSNASKDASLQLASVAMPNHGTVSLWVDRVGADATHSSAVTGDKDTASLLKKVTDALSGYWSVFSTMILLAVFAPAFWRLQRDVEDAAKIGLAAEALCRSGLTGPADDALRRATEAANAAQKALQDDVFAAARGAEADARKAIDAAIGAALRAVDDAVEEPGPATLSAAIDALRKALAQVLGVADIQLAALPLGLRVVDTVVGHAVRALGAARIALWQQPRTEVPTEDTVKQFIETLSYDDVTKWKEANGVDVSFSQVATALIAAAAPLLANSAIDLAKIVSL